MATRFGAMLKTRCVCFPRSGHHALVEVLQHYFGPQFRYCEPYTGHADGVQCFPEGEANFVKDHDFNLDTVPDNAVRHLVLIRDPIEAVESWMELSERLSGRPVEAGDSFGGRAERMQRFADFYAKWVVPRRVSYPRMVLEYRHLVGNPYAAVTSVIQFLTGVQNTDTDALRSALDARPLAKRRK